MPGSTTSSSEHRESTGPTSTRAAHLRPLSPWRLPTRTLATWQLVRVTRPQPQLPPRLFLKGARSQRLHEAQRSGGADGANAPRKEARAALRLEQEATREGTKSSSQHQK